METSNRVSGFKNSILGTLQMRMPHSSFGDLVLYDCETKLSEQGAYFTEEQIQAWHSQHSGLRQ